MSFFSLDSNVTPSKVRVAQYRDALNFVERSCRTLQYPSCRWDEVIQERSTGFFNLFRAMRELQSMTCTRMSDDDKNRYASAMTKAEQIMEDFGPEYYEDLDGLSINQTDEEIHWNWVGSRKADELTYLRSPNEYPAQHARVVQELQPKKSNKRRHLQVV